MTLIDTSLRFNIMKDMRADLIAKMNTYIEDVSKINLIKVGKLQDDYTENASNLMIHLGGEAFPDIRNFKGEHNPFGGTYAEIGENYFFRWRFKIQLILVYEGEPSRDIATETSMVIFSRLEAALETTELPNTRDSFGNAAHGFPSIIKSYTREGGFEDFYIWRGFIFFEVLVDRKPVVVPHT